ncbi:MAG: hypothetical protein HY721_31885 [Planctomycetes bacterium]|nr:hypothetical protein [Planctomycetota bacterium]
MKTVHMSSEMLEAIVEERRRSGIGLLDECWEVVDPGGRAFELWRLEGSEHAKVYAPARSAVTGLVFAQAEGAIAVEDPSSGRRWRVTA